VLVGFKLTAGLAEAQRLAAARALLVRARLDLVVSNDAARTGEHDHEAWLVTAEDVEARPVGKAAVAAAVVAALERRAAAARGGSLA
jgi:hypothetical protein